MCKKSAYQDLIVITNRKLVSADFISQLKKVAGLHPKSLILREKDLNDEDYLALSREVLSICKAEGVPFYVHSRMEMAIGLNCKNIHLSFAALAANKGDFLKDNFENISVSCHSKEEVGLAVRYGATRIILGTIFETECKPGLKGRGIEFVKDVCLECPIPVFAIGGIDLSNIALVKEAGAAGGCMMSGFMKM